MININAYQNKCLRTFFQHNDVNENIKQCLLGLSGETGEVIDIFKKHFYQDRNINKTHAIEEIGDVMWYVANLCNSLELNLSEVLDTNIQKLEKRYPSEKKQEQSLSNYCPVCKTEVVISHDDDYCWLCFVGKGKSVKLVKQEEQPYNSPINPLHYPESNDPIKYSFDNKLPFAEANVVKYVTRHRNKNGLEDLEKAEEYIKRIKKEYYK